MTGRIPLIFLPGLLCNADLWRNQINTLEDIADCTVADTTRYDDIAAIAHDVLASAPQQFALCALSMGGYVALEIMRQNPSRVSKLALFDTSARADTPEQKEKRRLLLVMSKSGQFRGVTPRLLPTLVHPNHLKDAALTKLIMEMAEKVGREAFQNQETAIMNRLDSRDLLETINCPTLVAGGRQDMLTPPSLLEEIASGIKDSVLHVIEDCGHLSPLEQPAKVNSLLQEWLLA